jgi:phage terminase large subunit-like protein
LKEDFENARESGEEELRRWASQHLNIEIGIALRSDNWVGSKFWSQTAEKVDLEQIIEHSQVITIGIDGGGLDDMLGLTICGRYDDGSWHTWSRAWIHKVAMERRKADIPVYKDFIKDGDLILVQHIGEDVEQLGEIVEQVIASEKLNKIGVDPSGIGSILDELVARGVDQEKQVAGISQGWRLMSAIKTSERKMAEGMLRHAVQPLMRWCVENAKVEPRGNAVMITKQISGSAKIDPLMAMFNAVELMSANPGGEKKYQSFFIGGDA